LGIHRSLFSLDKTRSFRHDNSMPYRDFDVPSLAKYLHLSPQQVVKLAERGSLPGRKVGGEWKFAKPDIHQWFEQQIGLSSHTELLHVENVLHQSAPPENQAVIRIADLLPLQAIEIPLPARTRNSVIEAMVEVAARTGWLWDPQALAEAIRAREDIHPTALDNGVALLHPRRPMTKILAQPFLALGCTVTGIPFGGTTLTDIFFLICSTDDGMHLRVLARLSRLLTVRGFLNALHQAPNAAAARQIVLEAEEKLSLFPS
jgi:PTS system nitrogen regulatory IIA component